MKSSFKKLPGSKIELEVTLTPPEFKDYHDREYEEAIRKVEIKGFRPGTAPKELADKVIDKEKIFDVAAREAVRVSLNEIKDEQKWSLIDTPKIEILEAAPTGDVGLKYKAELVVFPEVKLPDYKRIAARIFSEKKEIAVTPDEVEKSLEWLRKSRAAIVRAERPAEKGDLVEADVEVSSNGKALHEGAHDDRFVIGESNFVRGFDEALEHRRAGEELSFSLTPEPAKKFDFRVKIKGVFDRKLAPLDDEFAKALGSKFQSLIDVKKSIEEGIHLEKEKKELEKRRIKVLDEIAKAAAIDVPENMVERTLDGLVADFKAMAPPENINNIKEEELRKTLRERAVKNVLHNLVIYKIVAEQHLEPTPTEVEEELKRLGVDLDKKGVDRARSSPPQGPFGARLRAGETSNGVDRAKLHDYSYSVVQSRKVFEFLEKQ